jgi:hypothetical protein
MQRKSTSFSHVPIRVYAVCSLPPFSVSIHRDKMYVSTTKLTGGPLG